MSEEKSSWPELVGQTAEAARQAIARERPDVTIHVLKGDCCVTMDYRLDRVRVFTDDNGVVLRAPRLG
eukprot:m51a1_g11406 hypothetical protein (68) ;mRNA; r:7607-7938